MDLEMRALIDNNTWSLSDLPSDRKPVGVNGCFVSNINLMAQLIAIKLDLLLKNIANGKD